MKYQFVPNSPQYYEFMRLLRNDSRVQGGFIEQVDIQPHEQVAYMAKHGDRYHICLVDGAPAGYIGAIEGDIRIATHPDYQGKGVGRFLVTELLKLDRKVQAKVKVDNKASLRLFESAGFRPVYVILEPGAEADSQW